MTLTELVILKRPLLNGSPLDSYYNIILSRRSITDGCLVISAIDAYAEKGNRFPGRVFFFIVRVDSETECGSMAHIIEHPGLVWAPPSSSSSFRRSVRSALSGSEHSDRSVAFSWTPPRRIVAAGVALIKRRCRCLVTRHLPFVFAFVFVRPQWLEPNIWRRVEGVSEITSRHCDGLIFTSNPKYIKNVNVISHF